MSASLSLLYFPTAVVLGALHALEPGHAKTLTAAYLIGIRGTKRDAAILGLTIASTHSIVVVALSVIALYLGREAFADRAVHWLQTATGLLVVALGIWMLWRRWPRPQTKTHHHDGHLHSHGHSDLDNDEHVRAHAAAVQHHVNGRERPTLGQLFAFGAAGGMIPCAASITVMLLALSVGRVGMGLLIVLGFSLGLALTLIGVGMVVVIGVNRMQRSYRFDGLSNLAPVISSALVILTGILAMVFAH